MINVKMGKTIFLKQTKDLSTLYMYMVFVESLSPILFACRDDAANVYICLCHCQNAEKCEWVISLTTYERLIDVLTDKIPIREAFLDDLSTTYVATLRPNTEVVKVTKRILHELDAILPTANCYMEADPDEFSEELAILEFEKIMSAKWRRTDEHSYPQQISINKS